jgi:hypothetical protein
MPPVAITSGRHPYQIAVHVSAVLASTATIVTDQVPRSVDEVMSGPVQVLWAALLLLSGAAVVAGVWWPGRARTGLVVELSGVYVLAGGTSMYAIALFAFNGRQALVAGIFISGMAVGSWWRSAQIVRDARRLSEVGDRDDGC